MASRDIDDVLINFDHRRALRLLSHGVRTQGLRCHSGDLRVAKHAFLVFRHPAV